MPRGGRRPGAGAPPGNFNRLKHGRRSRQLRQLFIAAARTTTRQTVGRVLNAAIMFRAGLVPKRRRIDPLPPHAGAGDQAGHQPDKETPP